MIYPVFYPQNNFQYDVMGRIVILDGTARGAPNPGLRRFREMEKRVVSLSASVQKKLDVCDRLCKEVTGAPGGYQYDRSGTEYLNRYIGEMCIKTLLKYKESDILELEAKYRELEKDFDEWGEKARKKMDVHHTARAARERQEEQNAKGLARTWRANFDFYAGESLRKY
jgi:hypothetical protein